MDLNQLGELESQALAVVDVCSKQPRVMAAVLAEKMARAVLQLVSEARQAEKVTDALCRLTDACLPVDLWLGTRRPDPPTPVEQKRFADAFSAALCALPANAHLPQCDGSEDAIT